MGVVPNEAEFLQAFGEHIQGGRGRKGEMEVWKESGDGWAREMIMMESMEIIEKNVALWGIKRWDHEFGPHGG